MTYPRELVLTAFAGGYFFISWLMGMPLGTFTLWSSVSNLLLSLINYL